MFTCSLRPSISLPLRVSITLFASSSEDIVTNAKPRERPVVRSSIRLQSVTVPQVAHASSMAPSVVVQARLPTNNLLFMDCYYWFLPQTDMATAPAVLRQREELEKFAPVASTNRPHAFSSGRSFSSSKMMMQWIGCPA